MQGPSNAGAEEGIQRGGNCAVGPNLAYWPFVRFWPEADKWTGSSDYLCGLLTHTRFVLKWIYSQIGQCSPSYQVVDEVCREEASSHYECS